MIGIIIFIAAVVILFDLVAVYAALKVSSREDDNYD